MTQAQKVALGEVVAKHNRRGHQITDAEAKKCHTIIEQLRGSGDRGLTRRLVEHARDPKSPLHKHFEWNDSKAAQSHRIQQALHLINQIQFKLISGGGKEVTHVSAFVKTTLSDPAGRRHGVWVSAAQVMSNDQVRDAVLLTAIAQLEAWTNRYKSLNALAGVLPHIQRGLMRARAVLQKNPAKQKQVA